MTRGATALGGGAKSHEAFWAQPIGKYRLRPNIQRCLAAYFVGQGILVHDLPVDLDRDNPKAWRAEWRVVAMSAGLHEELDIIQLLAWLECRGAPGGNRATRRGRGALMSARHVTWALGAAAAFGYLLAAPSPSTAPIAPDLGPAVPAVDGDDPTQTRSAAPPARRRTATNKARVEAAANSKCPNGNCGPSKEALRAAIPLLQEFEAKNPRMIQAAVRHGLTLREIGEMDAARAVFARAVARGIMHNAWQAPSHLVLGLVARSVWPRDDRGGGSGEFAGGALWSRVRVARLLEEHSADIIQEGLFLMSKGVFNPQLAKKKGAGGSPDRETLVKLKLRSKGKRIEGNCFHTPKTCKLLESLPEVASQVKGLAMFEMLWPGNHQALLNGPTNTRVRTHLGVLDATDVVLRVGDSTGDTDLTWRKGKAFVVDDSFEHETWHNGSKPRLALVVDSWHPDMTEVQRRAAIYTDEDRAAYDAQREAFMKAQIPWM